MRWDALIVAFALAAGASASQAAGADRRLDPNSDANAEVMLGFIAFNSPYLYGSVERQDGLTCQNCHAPHGPTGIAATFSFRVAPPSLRGIAQRRPRGAGQVFASVEAFVRHAIEEEFDGPPPDRRVTRALAAYLGTLATTPTPETGNGAADQRLERYLDARAATAIALGRFGVDAAARDGLLATFSLLTARHLLGEWARDEPRCAGNAAEASMALADVDDAIVADQWPDAMAKLADAQFALNRSCPQK